MAQQRRTGRGRAVRYTTHFHKSGKIGPNDPWLYVTDPYSWGLVTCGWCQCVAKREAARLDDVAERRERARNRTETARQGANAP